MRAIAMQSRCEDAVLREALGSWVHRWALLRGKEGNKEICVADAMDHALGMAVQCVRRLALIEYVCSLAMSIHGYTWCSSR